MKIYTLALVLLSCSLNLLGQSAKNTEKFETEIRGLEQLLVQAVLNRDNAKLSDLFADDLAVNAPINRVSSKAGVLQLVRERKISYSSFETDIEHIHVFADFAVVMGSETVRPVDDSPRAGTVVKRRYTHVWKKRSGKWQLAVRHANVICGQ